MSTALQIAVDCVDPHRLAEFWAAALGYEVEDHADLVRRMLDAGHASPEDTVTVDGRLSWREAAVCIDPTGARPRMLFQVVPEQKVVKNRVHLDVRVGPGLVGAERVAALEAECARLVALGGVRVELLLADGYNESCLVMQDVEGNEFCLD